MSVRILIGAAIVTGGWLSACSRPAPGTAAADRQIQLAQPAATSDTAVVSDIEAGRPAKVATAVHRQPARRLS
ncbi:MAG TPA: hypothetical protein VFU23_16290, partial [Gemmatimonadales bacterium]|nr:hypothetical protein [Gemmatimonadales bacterium]